ncbi:MAG: hypothetical protein ACKVHE_25300, partial [Planctomycetales bacterium]
LLLTGFRRRTVGSKNSADHEVPWLPSVRSPGANDSPTNRTLDLVQPALQYRTRRSGADALADKAATVKLRAFVHGFHFETTAAT